MNEKKVFIGYETLAVSMENTATLFLVNWVENELCRQQKNRELLEVKQKCLKRR